jgi:hypothetical protein
MSHDRITDIERDVARGQECSTVPDPEPVSSPTPAEFSEIVVREPLSYITTGNVPAEGTNPSVDHPAHYNQHPSGVECIDIVRWMGFNLGNVVKYLWRDGLKDTEVELQDLEKAAWYLNNEINRRKANGTE